VLNLKSLASAVADTCILNLRNLKVGRVTQVMSLLTFCIAYFVDLLLTIYVAYVLNLKTMALAIVFKFIHSGPKI